MGTKTIRLDDEAYERLASRKREGESFSDVVKRVAGERSLLEIAGILSDEEAETMREIIAERRTRSRERSDEITQRLDGSEES
ncbi:MAG TPA: antitoxin VapB family protein [Halococcus sp.]|nr:antitoxin VapB family protein [Halococcus sp.]